VTNLFDRVLRRFDRVLELAVIGSIAVMVVLVSAEVFGRYVIERPIFFANEVTRIMFVWVNFFALPLALSRGRHVGITLMYSILPPAPARLLFRFACVASVVLLVVLLAKSFELLIDNWDQRMNTLPLSAGLFMLPIPISAFVALLHLANMLVTGDRAPMALEIAEEDE
jgi:TRAP-type C4-dicarboxylate transport system permease small subunit